jgi:hypothetical protein
MRIAGSVILAIVAAGLGAGTTALYTSRMSAEPTRSIPEANAADQTIDSIPVACTLTPDQLRERRAELLPALFQRAETVTDLPNGFKLQFASGPNLLSELIGVIEQESVCCRFLRFQLSIEPAAGPVTLEVTGPSGTREVLRGLW